MSLGILIPANYYPTPYFKVSPALVEPSAPMPVQTGTFQISKDSYVNRALPVNDTSKRSGDVLPKASVSANYTQPPSVYGGIQNYGMQRFLPIGPKRSFSGKEQVAILQGLKQWWPKIGAGYITPIPKLLASPIKSSVLSGSLGGLMTHVFVKGEEEAITHVNTPIAALGTLLFGTFGFIQRKQNNENILDLMQRLPEDATKRDMLSDPVYQADLQRKAESRRSGTTFDLLDFLSLLADSKRSGRSGTVRIRSGRGGGHH